MAIELDEEARKLLDDTHYAVVATLNRGGDPQTSVVWFVRQGDAAAFTSTRARQKVRNLQRDPRVSLTTFDPADPYRTVEIRGVAEVEHDHGREFQIATNHKFLGQDPPPDPEGTERVVVRVVPEKVNVFAL